MPVSFLTSTALTPFPVPEPTLSSIRQVVSGSISPVSGYHWQARDAPGNVSTSVITINQQLNTSQKRLSLRVCGRSIAKRTLDARSINY
ncbi:hypothetical protein RRG08_037786 [Elysia crispata]|uniref:Uncharacterized protein n=1 Tax=Elysia crispata TaxID=231223 RepID=A0AAE1EF75_9GAST|nr:hypothetical protein RRG08_037786 [Elysia crispata]